MTVSVENGGRVSTSVVSSSNKPASVVYYSKVNGVDEGRLQLKWICFVVSRIFYKKLVSFEKMVARLFSHMFSWKTTSYSYNIRFIWKRHLQYLILSENNPFCLKRQKLYMNSEVDYLWKLVESKMFIPFEFLDCGMQNVP